ncbi:tyrosine-type recombinase/integrase [Mycobacterium sp. CVI_P3]|uniref:Tyrosine-type recombinase/integrase n=1 Tax=Mycobacterium pinniadriaticum TaxID=2994102 RepID=A0ABT3SMD3_9MYCO|nr:tyrosine-type recombinase/integrase [Mycobacterium pinniadriaticum]MCX2934281.1 tyrosine-type recombinase/integrase [Mycobacterium pinniadriaticum]MCX2940681.1 tyrosine-type recombinase/integrase [Mycobacterium pinniadriaticum]
MPLPTDVGRALAEYLADVRPQTLLRSVFNSCKAPRRGIVPDLVSDVTRRACDRAGPPRVGAHRLRHTLAAEMLRRGVRLVDIGQVLRHRDLATTALYATVDVATLRSIALPWPANDERAGRCRIGLPAAAQSPGPRARRIPSAVVAFVALLDDAGLETVTVAAALGWVTAPDVDPSGTVASHRMTIARGFARHMAGLDGAHRDSAVRAGRFAPTPSRAVHLQHR